jgi:hypothetical protein
VTSAAICVCGFTWIDKVLSNHRNAIGEKNPSSENHNEIGEKKSSSNHHKAIDEEESPSNKHNEIDKEKSSSYRHKVIINWINRHILAKSWVRFTLVLLLIILAWLPSYLAYYPGICSYDFSIQLGQIVSGAYNDHHPLLHTLLLKGFMTLGSAVFGDVNAGIGLFALLQMILLAAVFAGGIRMLTCAGVRWSLRLVCMLYAMFFPVNWYMSITLAKDSVFTIFVGGFFLFYYAVLLQRKNSFRPSGWDLGYLTAVLGMILFRNNGRYALMVLLVMQLLTVVFGKQYRKFYARIFCVTLLGLLLGNGGLHLLFQETAAIQGDAREMISVPIQQVARVMVYHEDELSEQDRALVNEFILYEAYRNYRPEIADPVKGNTVSWVVRYKTKDFMDTYFGLFRRYPGDYLNAALALDAGYLWMGDVSHATINQKFAADAGLGYIQTRWVDGELNERGIYKDSKWPWLREGMEIFANENAYLSQPLLRFLVIPGTYIWAYLLLAGIWIIRRRFILLLPLAFVLGYYITLLLGPAVQLRYLYPLMICLPFLITLCIGRRDKPQAA